MAGPNRGMTKGPLPASVYWRRRAIVIVIALVLIFVIAKLLGAGSDGESSSDASNVSQASDPTTTVTVGASPSESDSASASTTLSDEPSLPAGQLPDPSGDCDPSDVTVTPEVKDATAYEPVTIKLQLQTSETPACTFTISPKTVQVRLARSGRSLWSSMDCPKALPKEDVTVYRDVAEASTKMAWTGRRSDAGICGVGAPWAHPGDYNVAAAALGGEPADADFELTKPGAEASESASPSESGSDEASASASASDSESSTGPALR